MSATSNRAPRSEATSPALEALRDAPNDDEPLTDEDREAIRKGREDVRQGRVMTTEELRRRLGL